MSVVNCGAKWRSKLGHDIQGRPLVRPRFVFGIDNWLWNVVGARPEAILICEVEYKDSSRLWYRMLGLAASNAVMEYLILKTTDLLS